MKKTWIALLASFIFPGAGHFYLGRIKKGVLLIGFYIVSLLMTAFLIGFIPLIIVWIYSMIDSYKLVPIVNDEYNNNHLKTT
jgi:TM2 domain-containing membrane protein YozV